jgi:predicted ATPase
MRRLSTIIRRLKVSNSALVGREKEKEILQRLCQQIQEDEEDPKAEAAAGSASTHQVCLVHGVSGSGKTSLVLGATNRTSESPPKEKSHEQEYYFISGKFDQFSDFSAPFSEIVRAFDQLTQLAPHDRIKECLTTEAKLLTRLIPSLKTILQQQEGEKEDVSGEIGDDSDAILNVASERLLVAFQVFLREFCSPQYPLILFMDDLQWSDSNSAKMLGQIAADTSIENFLFIGSYRDENADLVDLGIPSTIAVTDISIEPLNPKEVSTLVRQIVEWDDRDHDDDVHSHSISSFGNLIHRKTLGNPYYVVQYLQMLYSRQLLEYNPEKATWVWDHAKITATTEILENVVDILRARIECLSPQVQHVLIMAAYLGFVVDVRLLQCLKESELLDSFIQRHINKQQADGGEESDGENSNNLKEDDAWIEAALDQAEDEGFIDRAADQVCKFSHDRIQESFYNLIPEGQDRIRLHHLIGMHVWGKYGESNSAYLFLAADQLNRGASIYGDESDRTFLVQLNYKASLAARSKVGIETVAMFIHTAVEHAKEDLGYWERSYELLTDVYSLAAEVEFSRGEFEAMEDHIDTILHFAKHKDDTVRGLVCRALSHGVKRNFLQGINESRKLLQLLGVEMRKSSTLCFLLEVFRTKRALKSITDDDILNLPDMKDENKILAMKILQHGSIFGWNSDTTFAGLCYLKQIQMTIKSGWCEITPYALAGYGFLLAALGEEQEAFRYSQLALKSSKKDNARPDVNMMVHTFLAHFERPAYQSLQPLLAGYRSGLETGEMMCGTICMSCYTHVYFFSGLQLETFAEDMHRFTHQLKLCHQDLALAFVLPPFQLALNLSGQTSDPKDVSRKSMQNLEAYKDSMFVDGVVEDPSLSFVYYLQAYSGLLLDDLELAKKALDLLSTRKTRRLSGTQILNIFFALVDGLVAFALYRKTPRHKYRLLARSAMKEIKAITKKRSVNTTGIFLLLEAEQASLFGGTYAKVKGSYDRAITYLARTGFLHYSAMANELAGLWMIRKKDDFWARHYLAQAALSYADWGAKVKVDMMIEKHSSLDISSHIESVQRRSTTSIGRASFNAATDECSTLTRRNTESSVV